MKGSTKRLLDEPHRVKSQASYITILGNERDSKSDWMNHTFVKPTSTSHHDLGNERDKALLDEPHLCKPASAYASPFLAMKGTKKLLLDKPHCKPSPSPFLAMKGTKSGIGTTPCKASVIRIANLGNERDKKASIGHTAHYKKPASTSHHSFGNERDKKKLIDDQRTYSTPVKAKRPYASPFLAMKDTKRLLDEPHIKAKSIHHDLGNERDKNDWMNHTLCKAKRPHYALPFLAMKGTKATIGRPLPVSHPIRHVLGNERDKEASIGQTGNYKS
ncbi:hypothetical protein K7X08_002679 [Anisodus acutangulus]|uniref:Uncharacterized protein n=1 Tax=Anisodus acutangulus TaxID=402998 RepID=A0A9Q1L3K0_9SOLA|nr:hypothetical protein K7X08_002679 [Anisodus acutangulus]